MTEFYQQNMSEYQVQHMTENFNEWNTIQTYHDKKAAQSHAKDYAKANPNIEVQIVKTTELNY